MPETHAVDGDMLARSTIGAVVGSMLACDVPRNVVADALLFVLAHLDKIPAGEDARQLAALVAGLHRQQKGSDA